MNKMDHHAFEKQVTSKKKLFVQKTNQLKRMKDKDLDSLFYNLHTAAFQKIECLDCARCCSMLGPRLTRTDISRMASAVRMKESDFMKQYTRTDEDGDIVFVSMPCPFLLSDNKCMIYTNRPKACREYPHTDQKNMRSVLKITLKNAETCPAVSYILDQIRL